MKTSPEFTEFVGPNEIIFFDDFHEGVNTNATTALDKWYFLETQSGATQTVDTTQNGGVLKLLQTTGDNDVISLQANSGFLVNALASGKPLEFGVRFQTADVDDVDLHMGLSIQDVSMAASAPADFVAFQIVEGTATLKLVCSKDSVLSSTTCCTVVDATWIRAYFRYTPTSTTDIGDIEWEVHTNGGVYRGTLPSAGNFPDDVVIFPTMQVQNGSTDADASYVDYIYAKGTRAWTAGTG